MLANRRQAGLIERKVKDKRVFVRVFLFAGTWGESCVLLAGYGKTSCGLRARCLFSVFSFFVNSITVGVVWGFVKLGWGRAGGQYGTVWDSMGQYGTVWDSLYCPVVLPLFFRG